MVVKDAIRGSPVGHGDETGIRVDGPGQSHRLCKLIT
jgi:hypothetical protein